MTRRFHESQNCQLNITENSTIIIFDENNDIITYTKKDPTKIDLFCLAIATLAKNNSFVEYAICKLIEKI
jgi:hypothetical protein